MFGLFDEFTNENENKLIIKGTGKKRIEIKPIEIRALAFLENQRILTVSQLYQYCTEYLLYAFEEYSFKNRIRRLEEFKIIRSVFHNEPSFNSDRFKCIAIGTKGIDILSEFGYLHKEYNKKEIYRFLNKKNFIHTIGVQQAVINIFSYAMNQSLDQGLIFDIYFYVEKIEKQEGIMKKVISNFISLSPEKHRYETLSDSSYKHSSLYSRIPRKGPFANNHNNYFKNRRIMTVITIVRPDWIITLSSTTSSKVLNIEFDVGTEKLNDLVYKIIGYIEVCRMHPDQRHGVIICLPDETFLSRNRFGNRSKRIHNINEIFKNSANLMEDVKAANLKIYVVPLKSVGQAAHHFFTGIEDNSTHDCGILNDN